MDTSNVMHEIDKLIEQGNELLLSKYTVPGMPILANITTGETARMPSTENVNWEDHKRWNSKLSLILNHKIDLPKEYRTSFETYADDTDVDTIHLLIKLLSDIKEHIQCGNILLKQGNFEDITHRHNTAVPSLETMLAQDIGRCDGYLQNPQEDDGKILYTLITARYDSIIKNFGDGLYSYIPDYHFYDPDIDISTINHNLSILLQKMLTYQAMKFGEGIASGGNKVVLSDKKIFIVHGHDNEAKTETARVIEKLGLEAIILHEQASGGKTIIEKIERYSDVGFAVVLYTPCDEGYSKTEKTPKNRARQNVVFEHGYLIGKLGRNRVCALVKDDIETPGDISGVVYVPMDNAGAWKYRLIEEMNEVGFGLSKDKV